MPRLLPNLSGVLTTATELQGLTHGQFFYVRPDWKAQPYSISLAGASIITPSALDWTVDEDPSRALILSGMGAGAVSLHFQLFGPTQLDAVALINTNLAAQGTVHVTGGTIGDTTDWHLLASQRLGVDASGRSWNVWLDLRAHPSTPLDGTRTYQDWTITLTHGVPLPIMAIGEIWLCTRVGQLGHGISWGASYGLTHPYTEVMTNAGTRWRYSYGARRRIMRGSNLTSHYSQYAELRDWAIACQGTQPSLIVPPVAPNPNGLLEIEPWMVHWKNPEWLAVRSAGWAHTMQLEFEELSPGAPFPIPMPAAATPILQAVVFDLTGNDQVERINSVGVMLTGQNFIPGGTTLTVSGGITPSDISVHVSGMSLHAALSIPVGTAVGMYTVSVTTIYGTSETLQFSVVAPGTAYPTLASVVPNQIHQASTGSVVLTGTNFVTGATTIYITDAGVTFSGGVVSGGGTTLTANFTCTPVATINLRHIHVGTSQGHSNSLPFTVLEPLPTLTSVTPANGVVGSVVSVTLVGTHFNVDNTVVNVSGAGITVSEVVVASDTSLTADFTIASGAVVGTRNVRVTTPVGTSGVQVFTIVAP